MQKMNFKQSLVVAVACLIVAATASEHVLYHHDADMGLLSFMSRSNDILQRNPARSFECFNYYIPLIEYIAKQYETNYEACLAAAVGGRKQAEENTVDQRKDLADRAEASCALLSKCGESKTVDGQFDCYIKGGSENARTMYDINADASEQLAELLEQFRLIENKENRCTNDTKRAYEKESAEAYEGFNKCMLGISEVPTDAPWTSSSEEPSTDVSTTNTLKTDAPITAASKTNDHETEINSSVENSAEDKSPENDSIEENSPEESSAEHSKEDELPQEDLSRMPELKKLLYRLGHYKP